MCLKETLQSFGKLRSPYLMPNTRSLTLNRMVLYFPVSALVTLFGNILQNPLDPRARSDTRLMNMVVTFLSALGQEVETGGVHRMLGICSEFERISKVMIERAEKENAGRRKRKNAEAHASKSSNPSTNAHTNAARSPHPASTHGGATGASSTAQTPRPTTANANTPTPRMHPESLSPHTRTEGQAFSPMTNTTSPSPGNPPPGWNTDFGGGDPMEFTTFAELTGFGQLPNNGPPPPLQSPPAQGMGFQQPLIPQDLYQLPMSFDWDWAEMSGGAYPSVENGNFGEQR